MCAPEMLIRGATVYRAQSSRTDKHYKHTILVVLYADSRFNLSTRYSALFDTSKTSISQINTGANQ
jgi:hypothetical protein